MLNNFYKIKKAVSKNMVKKVLFLFCLLLFSLSINAQKKFAINGTIKSKKTGETIIAASIRVANSTIGTTSNEYGFYSITLPKGNYNIEYSAVGKKTDTINFDLNQDIKQNILLQDENKELGEVIVKSTGGGRIFLK